MTPSFQFVALPSEEIQPLLRLDAEKLRARGIVWRIVDAAPGYPCRVSLQDAQVGERVLLLPYTHHDVASPYRASGPIYVREAAQTAQPAVNEIPTMFRYRLLSVRAYNAKGMMVDAAVTDGRQLEAAIGRLFGDSGVEYLHLHNAGAGCFNCRVDRA